MFDHPDGTMQVQLCAIPECHQFLGIKTSTDLSISFPQKVLESNEVASQPTLLQTGQSVLSLSSQDMSSNPFKTH